VTDITEKSGRTGRLCFVTVDHEIGNHDGVAVRERQTVVYREPPAADAPPPRAEPPPASAAWRAARSADPRLLFRYSALTFNAHRIHYDHPYATGVEGYSGLVVHGPLQATLMMQLIREHSDRRVAGFEFQGKQPLFAGEPFEVCGETTDGDEVALWVQRADGVTASGLARLE
jgi:3-methylfumaryl-CoA hydratase